jgi:D-3-phosphoglycerate dehydrogenase / 2-oxoglutarate reductase
MKKQCLFSAPFSFLPDDVIRKYRNFMPTEFREIWSRADLLPDDKLTAWAMNPGQNFIVDESILEYFPNIQVLSTPSTGSNHIDRDVCARRGVAVFSLLDNRSVLDTISASAEFTFLLLINSLRRLDFSLPEVTEGRWRANEDEMRGRELAGKHIGLVGLGRIGRRMARYCQAFDATVSFYDPYVKTEEIPAWPLKRIFEDSDAVCICPALTDETRGMIDYNLLKRLRTGASFVNTSRGEVLVDADLARILAERPDLRVGLDVLTGEVTASQYQSPLIEYHRKGQIVITPHIAGATVESQAKAAIGALNSFEAYYSASKIP